MRSPMKHGVRVSIVLAAGALASCMPSSAPVRTSEPAGDDTATGVPHDGAGTATGVSHDAPGTRRR